MAVRSEFRLLLASESKREDGHFLKLDERGSDGDRSVFLTIAGAGMNPFEDDPVLELSMEEAVELRDCLDQLIKAG